VPGRYTATDDKRMVIESVSEFDHDEPNFGGRVKLENNKVSF
jgi:hypothetical protein